MTRTLQTLLYTGAVALGAALAGCADNTGVQPRIPAELRTETTTLSGTPGYPVTSPVRVRLVDRKGNGVPGFTIDFAVVRGAGTATPSSATTDADGYATAQWVLGNSVGEQELRATVRDMSLGSVAIKADAEFGVEASLVAVSAPDLGSVIGACRVVQDITVKAVDKTGAPAAGVFVDFSATSGGQMDPAVVTTDASGIAQSSWTPGTGGGQQTVTASLRTPGAQAVASHATVLPRAVNGFAAVGNSLIGPDCQPYVIRGIARPSLEWEPFGSPHFDQVATEFTQMKSWGANTVRIPVNQTFWVQSSAHYVPGYRDFVIATVAKARAAGLNVIFDLHIGDRGQQNFDPAQGMPQMPDVNHSLPFWKDVAAIYKNDGGVIFEMYNEPHDVTSDVWLNGGTIQAGPNYAGGPIGEAYQAVGMQQLYDAIRAEGAQNLIIASGTHWGYYLSTINNYRVKGYNIAYSSHPYDYDDKQPNVWENDWGFMASQVPVVVTEFGAYDCNADGYYTRFLDYAKQKNIGWIAWAWWTPPDVSSTYSAAEREHEICQFPSLIRDWNGTPSVTGTLIKARLGAGG
jgi:aryl-phospho-beta-D-glucosidase BglC (GH1 family)